MSEGRITVVGAGLAGCEAALWLAQKGVSVRLVEQKPRRFSPAHHSPHLAELVCSNSLKAERLDSAAGLLKAEMRLLGSSLLPLAEACRVAAGGALAVDREAFSAAATQRVAAQPGITLVCEEATALPTDGVTIVATGPLTDGALAAAIAELSGAPLSFYDAAAPIVTAASLDMRQVFAASRYGRGDADYLNCPFDKAGYEAFHAALVAAQRAPLHAVDQPGTAEGRENYYEGCMPVEVLARRGPDTLRFGPLRPVGLTNPHTGHRPWANVQLRREDAAGTLYNLVGFQTNLKFSEQKRVFGLIPGLENAEYARYGVMHRNTFLNSPEQLAPDFSLKGRPQLFFAGQITGVEGYMESAASGLLAARAALAAARGTHYAPPPPQTMCGALCRYLAAENRDFQPMGANMGLLPALGQPQRDKRLRYQQLAQRALDALAAWTLL
ncbi:MAG: methylenetetrahydrofolate--tRNA-(uracil(54)-C(5))-methyltransferase (FADH(2)-oxidizing) TrmFO [Oscillospiraceae bacterium]